MAVLLAFELTAHQVEVRERLIENGFLTSMVGYHTRFGDKIQSDLPSTFLFHETHNAAEALDALCSAVKGFGIDVEDGQQRAFAVGVEGRGAVNWRGIVSRFHPLDEE